MKKRIGSLFLVLALCLSLMPMTVLAEDAGTASSVVEVSTKDELNAALNNASVTEIHIIADMTYNDPLVASKPVQVNEGVTLTLNDYDTTVSGTIVNNGTIQVTSRWKCLWKAKTSGTGKLIGGKDAFDNYSTYVDYGCVPEAMLENSNCLINIVKDISQPVTATLPADMKTGDTIQVTVSNLIDGVNPADVFKFTWKDGSFTIYDGQSTPTLTQSGTLKLTLSMKTPYVMCTSNGTNGSLGAQGTVTQKLLDTIYVNQINGNDSNLGDTAAQPVKSIGKALDKVTDGGKIVLLSDYSSRIVFNKSVTVKSADGNAFALTSSYSNYVSDGVTVTFENLKFTESTQFSRYSGTALGTGSLSFKNCTGSLSISSGDISNITMENSQLSGTIFASNLLTMKDSTFSGKFNTKDFTAESDCTISCKKNAPSYISGTITVPTATPVKLVPFENAEAGAKLLEVSKSSDQTVTNHFVLADTQNNKYGIQLSKQYNGTYLCLAQRITSENGKIAVGYEPQIKHVPNNPARVRLSGFGSEISTLVAAWSGNADTSWSANEIPKLTVTLNADDFYFFDNSFDVSELQVYSWTDMTTSPSYDVQNTSVTCSIEQDQGVGEDGKTYTFTITYPAIARLPQTITVDATDRTANCGDTLQPRQVSAQGTIRYESSDTTVATVDTNGVVKALKAGETTITIRAAETADYQAAATSYKLIVSHKYAGDWEKDDTGYYKECACGNKEYVTAVPVLGVALDNQTMSLTAGSTGTLTATIEPADAENKSLTWTSDNEAVAIVDENGKVTAVAEGTARITVKTVDGEKTAVCVVTVTAKSSGGSSTGSSSAPTYPVTTPDKTENGAVTVSPKNATGGSTVTVTVTPNSGYTLETLTVTDKNGKELKLTDKGDGKYTFTMPSGKVDIKATFMEDNSLLNFFYDVPNDAYYFDAVKWAVKNGITAGVGDNLFAPNQPCTRAEIVTFLWRAAGSPVVNYAMNMSDIPEGAYYAEAVRWALSEGIAVGTSADTFSPDDTCTRAEAVTFLCRAKGSKIDYNNEFTDVGGDDYYADAVAWAEKNNVTVGVGNDKFAPDDDCSRGQIVTFLYRTYQN